MITQTFSDGEYIYSVYLMFLYVKNPNIRSKRILVRKLLKELKDPSWGDPEKGLYYSALDVLQEPGKYPQEFRRIQKADLRYPIMIDGRKDERHNFNIVDGVHRLSKAFLLKKKFIRAYVFPAQMMKKFIIAKVHQKGVWQYVDRLTKDDLEKLYHQRFS